MQGVKKSGQEAKPLNRASSNRSLNTAGLKKETLESIPASSENKYAPVKIARLAIFENPVMAGTDSLFFPSLLLIPAAGLCPSAKVRAPGLCPVTPGPSAPLWGISARWWCFGRCRAGREDGDRSPFVGSAWREE